MHPSPKRSDSPFQLSGGAAEYPQAGSGRTRRLFSGGGGARNGAIPARGQDARERSSQAVSERRGHGPTAASDHSLEKLDGAEGAARSSQVVDGSLISGKAAKASRRSSKRHGPRSGGDAYVGFERGRFGRFRGPAPLQQDSSPRDPRPHFPTPATRSGGAPPTPASPPEKWRRWRNGVPFLRLRHPEAPHHSRAVEDAKFSPELGVIPRSPRWPSRRMSGSHAPAEDGHFSSPGAVRLLAPRRADFPGGLL